MGSSLRARLPSSWRLEDQDQDLIDGPLMASVVFLLLKWDFAASFASITVVYPLQAFNEDVPSFAECVHVPLYQGRMTAGFARPRVSPH